METLLSQQHSKAFRYDRTYLVDLQLNGGADSVIFMSNETLIEHDYYGNLSVTDTNGHRISFSAENIISEESSSLCDIYTINNNIVLTIFKQDIA